MTTHWVTLKKTSCRLVDVMFFCFSSASKVKKSKKTKCILYVKSFPVFSWTENMSFRFRRHENCLKDHEERLSKKSNLLILYHQTSKSNAKSILNSQEMIPGKRGMAGPGIYFAGTKYQL